MGPGHVYLGYLFSSTKVMGPVDFYEGLLCL